MKPQHYGLEMSVPFQHSFLADGVFEVDLAGGVGYSFAPVDYGLIFGVVWTEGPAGEID